MRSPWECIAECNRVCIWVGNAEKAGEGWGQGGKLIKGSQDFVGKSWLKLHGNYPIR